MIAGHGRVQGRPMVGTSVETSETIEVYNLESEEVFVQSANRFQGFRVERAFDIDFSFILVSTKTVVSNDK